MQTPELGSSWRVDRDPEGRRTFWLDRPGASQNSIDTATLRELDGLLSQIGGDATSLVIRSAKPKGFCAGADLKELRNFANVAEVEAFARFGGRVFDRLAALPIPTVAILQGVCLGGGFELALACSRRLVSPHAAIGLPEALLGLLPGWGATRRLPGLIGLAPTLDLLLSGRTIDESEALSLSLVDAIAEPEPLETALSNLCETSWSRKEIPLPGNTRELLTSAQASLPDDELRPARERILQVLAAELLDGTDSAARGLAELVFEPKGRECLESFASRHSPRRADQT
jgi:3-hydroxyacyl-CoA dehydrogenase/enoyl-CoA hydratase/3-hydroxybutyryl-CoA epimerase